MAFADIDSEMAALRDPPIINWVNTEPHTAPASIPLLGEYYLWGGADGAPAVRGDNVSPLQVGIKITRPGRYRFTLELANPSGAGIGLLQIAFSDIAAPLILQAAQADKLRQFADIDLKPGTYLLTLTSQTMTRFGRQHVSGKR